MFDQILVPTDGSDVAAAAGEAAVTLARRFDGTLHVVHVAERLEGAVSDDGPEEFTRREGVTDTFAEMASAHGVETTTESLEERASVHETILGYADDHGIDCIVMGTHGRTGVDRFVLGSVTELTLRESSVPVMTVHQDTDVDPGFDSVLLPTDGSSCAAAATDHAVDLALATDGELHVVNVVDIGVVWGEMDLGMVLEALEETGEQALQDVRERAKSAGVSRIEGSVLSGIPHRAIVDYAEENDVDCIVMGTHGRSGIDRFLLGSVTERVIRQTDVPVLAIREPDDAA